MTARRAPAPPGVVTGPRLFLLREVAAGRVRWLPVQAEAWLLGDEYSEVTGLWGELVRSGWARVVPWDMSEPTPASAETKPTTTGEEVLIKARRRAPKKATQAKAATGKKAPVQRRSAVQRRTYRPPWLVKLRKLRPTAKRRQVRAAVRRARDRLRNWWDTRASVQRARAASKRWRPRAVRRRIRAWFKPKVRGHYRRAKGDQ